MKYDLVGVMEKKAKKSLVKVVICEGWDERCLQATDEIIKKGFAEIVLLGDEKTILNKANELNVDISKAEIVDYKNSELIDELTQKLYELRKHKGMTVEKAKELLSDENYFGCMYAYAGYADACAGSAIGPTAALMRPALQILRKKDVTVSEITILDDKKNNRTLFASDVSLNISPDSKQLAQIALNAAKVVKDFDIIPKLAMLSFSTKGSGGDGPEVQLIRDAIDIVKKEDPNLIIDGEMQVDAAVSPKAAIRKCPDSILKGEANTLIFPNLTVSNIFAHSIMQFSDMEMSFTINSGMQKPVAILARSTPYSFVRNMIVCLAMEVNSE